MEIQRDRPRFTRLAPKWNWEFCRRNPLYLEHWQNGNRYWSMTPEQRQQAPDREKLESAYLVLFNLGWSGSWGYPHPAKTSQQLGLAELDGHQLARHLSVRDLAQAMTEIEPAVRKQIAGPLAQDLGKSDLLRQIDAIEDLGMENLLP